MKSIFVLVLLLEFLITAEEVIAQRQLFLAAKQHIIFAPEQAKRQKQRLEYAKFDSSIVSINAMIADNSVLQDSVVILNLPDETLTAVGKFTTDLIPGTSYWVGKTIEKRGEVRLWYNGDTPISGQLMFYDLKIRTYYQFGGTSEDGICYVTKRRRIRFNENSNDVQDKTSKRKGSVEEPAESVPLGSNALYTVNIFVALTQKAAQAFINDNSVGSVANGINRLRNEFATIYNNSFVSATVEVNITTVYIVNYNEDAAGIDNKYATHLNSLINPADAKMDEIHLLRDFGICDIVLLLVEKPRKYMEDQQEKEESGLAQKIGATAGEAFAVSNSKSIIDGITFTSTHELGHLFGAGHEQEAIPFLEAVSPYGYGNLYKIDPDDAFIEFATVMATLRSSYDRIPAFSSPNINYQGFYTGDATVRDVARVHRERAFLASNFRNFPPANAPVPAGTEARDVMTISASNEVNNSGNFYAYSGSNVTFQAGNKVSLKNGFRASSGSKFRAKISTGFAAQAAASTGNFGLQAVAPAQTASQKINVPTENRLSQNYPNPFNPATTIQYALKAPAQVSLKIYDVLGRTVAELVNENKPAGYYAAQWNAARMASGTYFYRLVINSETSQGDFVETKKLTIIK